MYTITAPQQLVTFTQNSIKTHQTELEQRRAAWQKLIAARRFNPK